MLRCAGAGAGGAVGAVRAAGVAGAAAGALVGVVAGVALVLLHLHQRAGVDAGTGADAGVGARLPLLQSVTTVATSTTTLNAQTCPSTLGNARRAAQTSGTIAARYVTALVNSMCATAATWQQAHEECVPELPDVQDCEGSARTWTRTGDDASHLICPSCWGDNSTALLADGSATVDE